ncbi:MAG: hypothetical protein ACI4PQ_04805 [Butyricicoccaceae bacterium]
MVTALALSGTASADWKKSGSIQTLSQMELMDMPVNAREGASRETAAALILELSQQEDIHAAKPDKAPLGISLSTITAQEYAAQLLHVLGYSTDEVVQMPIMELAVENGLCTEKQAQAWSERFTDENMAEMTCRALSASYQGSKVTTLGDQLVCDGVLTQTAAENAGVSTLNGRLGFQLAEGEQISYHLKASVLEDGTYMLVNRSTGQKISRSGDELKLSGAKENQDQYFDLDFDADGTRIYGYETERSELSLIPERSEQALMSGLEELAYRDFAFCEESDGVYSIRLVKNGDVALAVEDGAIIAEPYEQGKKTQQWTLKKPAIPATESVSKLLEEAMRVHPDGQALGSGYHFAGASQCMAFAREIYSRLFGTVACWDYSGNPKTSADSGKFTKVGQISSFSESEVRSLMSKAQPGDVLQTNKPKQHSMIVVSTDETGFTVYDANWAGSNVVDVRHIDYGGMSNQNSANMSLLHANNYPTK